MRVLAAMAILVFGLIAADSAFAVNPDEMLKDPALEARARVLSEELRCLVCQNQSIDDSDAALAHDIRVLLRERLTKGDTDSEAIGFLVARYGEFILLKPPFNWHTLVLWLVPPGVLVIGAGAVLLAWTRQRRLPTTPAELDDGEKETLRRLAAEQD